MGGANALSNCVLDLFWVLSCTDHECAHGIVVFHKVSVTLLTHVSPPQKEAHLKGM